MAFFYGKPLPVAELGQFDWVVVEADNVDAHELSALQRAGVRVFAYLSLGESSPGSVDAAWVIGRNVGWASAIMDPAAAGWRARVEARARALRARGFDGLFLDTLDSYMAALEDGPRRRKARDALASLVRAIHHAAPDAALFFNRGFELLDEVGTLASGLAAESLFAGWSSRGREYVEVAAGDRAWLVGQLRAVREKLGIPVVVVDYLPPAKRDAMREVARRIEALGFVPWVANAALDALGVGSVEAVPRRVLLLYDGGAYPDVGKSPAHRLAAFPLESLGLVPTYVNVREGLPSGVLAGRCAGIVSWFTSDDLPAGLGYPGWMLRHVEDGVRVAVLGRLGFSPSAALLTRLGLAAVGGHAARAVGLARRDGLVGLEAPPEPRTRGLTRLRVASHEADVHLGVEDAAGRTIDAVLTAPWGGLALDPYVVEVGYQGRVRWILDPFAFLERALGVAAVPALDLTTESGARLLLVTADGEGLAAPGGGGQAGSADALRVGVLEPEPVATTILLGGVAGGAGEGGPGPSQRDLEALAALPFVELADVRAGPAPAEGKEVVPEATVRSMRLVEVARWDAQGGPPVLASVPPSGPPEVVGRGLHLPGLGESVAADLAWRGVLDQPHVAALAELEDGARRLQPLGLHYPSALASTPGGVQALREVLRWVVAQRTLPLWLSEYAARIAGFRAATLARTLDGRWSFRGLGALRTARVARALGWPDLGRSRGVAGVAARGDALYVSFAGEDRVTLALSEKPPGRPHLVWSNAVVEAWEGSEDTVTLRLRGHGPVRLEVGGAEGKCELDAGGETFAPVRVDGRQIFAVQGWDTGEATLRCPRG